MLGGYAFAILITHMYIYIVCVCKYACVCAFTERVHFETVVLSLFSSFSQLICRQVVSIYSYTFGEHDSKCNDVLSMGVDRGVFIVILY